LKKLLRGIISATLACSLMFSAAIVAHAVTVTYSGLPTGEGVQAAIEGLASGDVLDLGGVTIIGGFIIDKDNVTVQNGTVILQKGSIPATAYSGINISASDVTLKKVTVQGIDNTTGTFEDICINVVVLPGANNVTIQENTFLVGNTPTDATIDVNTGLITYYGTNQNSGLVLQGNTFKPLNGTGFRPFIINAGSDGVKIDGNKLIGNFQADPLVNVNNATISNNIFDSSYSTANGYSITVWGDTGTVNANIANNTFSNPNQTANIRLYNSNAALSGNNFNTKLVNGHILGLVTLDKDGNATNNLIVSGYEKNVQPFYQDANGNFYFIQASSGGSSPVIPPPSVPPITITDPFVHVGQNTTPPPSTTTTTSPKTAKATKNAVINAKDSTIMLGGSFDVMKNVYAIDNNGKGKDITNKVTATGQINSAVAGTYKVTYKVIGANGKAVTKTVTVTVVNTTPAGPQKCTPNVPGSPWGSK